MSNLQTNCRFKRFFLNKPPYRMQDNPGIKHNVLPEIPFQSIHNWECICYEEGPSSQSHYDDVIMGSVASQITSLTIVYSAVYSGANQRKQQSSASLAFVRGIHRWPVNSPHKWPVTRKLFPFDDVIMQSAIFRRAEDTDIRGEWMQKQWPNDTVLSW